MKNVKGKLFAGVFAAALLVSTPLVAATYTVTNVNESGPGSLSQAMLDADVNPGVDSIEFTRPIMVEIMSGDNSTLEIMLAADEVDWTLVE